MSFKRRPTYRLPVYSPLSMPRWAPSAHRNTRPEFDKLGLSFLFTGDHPQSHTQRAAARARGLAASFTPCKSVDRRPASSCHPKFTADRALPRSSCTRGRLRAVREAGGRTHLSSGLRSAARAGQPQGDAARISLKAHPVASSGNPPPTAREEATTQGPQSSALSSSCAPTPLPRCHTVLTCATPAPACTVDARIARAQRMDLAAHLTRRALDFHGSANSRGAASQVLLSALTCQLARSASCRQRKCKWGSPAHRRPRAITKAPLAQRPPAPLQRQAVRIRFSTAARDLRGGGRGLHLVRLRSDALPLRVNTTAEHVPRFQWRREEDASARACCTTQRPCPPPHPAPLPGSRNKTQLVRAGWSLRLRRASQWTDAPLARARGLEAPAPRGVIRDSLPTTPCLVLAGAGMESGSAALAVAFGLSRLNLNARRVPNERVASHASIFDFVTQGGVERASGEL
ncbi:hypothetical protein DFH09DRAFT_1373660 [Mycena vulgaris]|nr:hypothetical protein DFH09DRAFT_1373660 [Mycena vulgaris]